MVHFTEHQWDTILALCEAVVPPMDPSRLSAANLSPLELAEYALLLPLTNPRARAELESSFAELPLSAATMLGRVLAVLNSRVLAPLLTNLFTFIRDMLLAQRQQLFRLWRASPLVPKRQLARTFQALGGMVFVKTQPLHYKAVGIDPVRTIPAGIEATAERLYDFAASTVSALQAALQRWDVVVCGSGSGGGVVALHLARQGFLVLVVEKGKAYTRADMEWSEPEALGSLFVAKGLTANASLLMLILAGQTLGGGSTVNWLALLKPPSVVRQEWAHEYGVEWATLEQFERDFDYVADMMGVLTSNIHHLRTNAMLLQASSRLGHAALEIPQNCGGERHACGLCHMGCAAGIKRGGMRCWLRDAVEHGAKLCVEVEVARVAHAHGSATGVVLLANDGNNSPTPHAVRCSRVVVLCGLLLTPVLLQNLGFRNKHIGKHLRLHPTTTVVGWVREPAANPWHEAIMTAVVTEHSDRDGHGHGARLELILHLPILQLVQMPWRDGELFRQDLLRFQQYAQVLVIIRDKDEGTVQREPGKRGLFVVDYECSKFDLQLLQEGVVAACDVLYVGGANEIIHPVAEVPRFASDKPEAARDVRDADYQRWRAQVVATPLVPYRLALGTAHQMSLCRMLGKGAAHGAVDTNGRLFECKNVFVADASVFPTASGVNPMMLCMTFAHHVAQGLVDDLARGKL